MHTSPLKEKRRGEALGEVYIYWGKPRQYVCITTTTTERGGGAWANLKDGQTGLIKCVKRAPRLVGVEFGAKNLHAQEGKDKDEEHEEDEEGVDAGNRVHQGLDQVAHRGPVSDKATQILTL